LIKRPPVCLLSDRTDLPKASEWKQDQVPTELKSRNLIFGILMILVVCAVLEGISFLGVSYLHRQWMTPRDIVVLLGDRMKAPSPGFDLDREDRRPHPTIGRNTVVHPYVGFVPSPEFKHDSSPQGTAAAYGFPNNPQGILHKRSSETLIVALFGGSVAWRFPPPSRDLLKDLLTESGRFQDRRLIFLNLAYPGYKQPQQLMILNYLLVLGAEFDIVLNLDGFNEITLPVNENMHRGVFPFFPRGWFFRVGKFDPETRITVGEVVYLENKRRLLTELHSAAPFRHSMTSGLIWTVRDRFISIRIAEQSLRLVREPAHESKYVVTGPPFDYEDQMQAFSDFVRIWRRSSAEMNQLCRGHAIEYYHCLQPSLHVPESKPLSKREKELERQYPNLNKGCVRRAYPLLISMGQELSDAGVAFIDLTHVFRGTSETIYRDSCHLNKQGYRLMTERMADCILAREAAGNPFPE